MNDSIMKQLKKQTIEKDQAKVVALEIILKSIKEHEMTTFSQVKGEIHYWIDIWNKEIKKNEESLNG